MLLRADFGLFELVRFTGQGWSPSPMAGVDRIMLDRVGEEVARATSFVRYQPNSRFSSHVHGGGEEILVISGVFSDEYGDYPAGTYIRNPIGTRHAPSIGGDGAVIFVKLHQFDAADSQQFTLSVPITLAQCGEGFSSRDLHRHGNEYVRLVKLDAGEPLDVGANHSGIEIVVLEGDLYAGQESALSMHHLDWCRHPCLSEVSWLAGPKGSLLYVKTGHLQDLS